MGLEIAGSRILAPVFGTSIFVWGALITTFLASLAIGYAFGGRVADRWPRPELLATILAAAGVLLWIGFFRPDPVLQLLSGVPVPDRFRSLFAALALFSVPSVLMGAVTPFAVRLRAKDVATIGASAGRLSAISTTGSIAGTFAMTFLLIPAYPIGPILWGLGATLVVSAWLALARPMLLYGALAAFSCVAAGSAYLLVPAPAESPVPGGTLVFQKETAYHRLRVVDQGRKRALYFDNRLQGWLPRVGGDNPERGYFDGLLLAVAFRREMPRRAVHIGLGAGVLPAYLTRHLPEVESTSIDIDPEVVRTAERYFGFHPDANDRVIVGDGRRELERQVESTDVIFEDAFFADSIPFHMVTKEFYELCFRKLSDDGVFAANFGGLLTGEGNALFWSAYRTAAQVFPRVYVFCQELSEGKPTFKSTAILIATKAPGTLSKAEILEKARLVGERLGRPQVAEYAEFLYDGEIRGAKLPLLTDAYSPTDALQHFRRH